MHARIVGEEVEVEAEALAKKTAAKITNLLHPFLITKPLFSSIPVKED